MQKTPPYITDSGFSTRLWETDAGGSLGKIQLALARFINSLKHRTTANSLSQAQFRDETLLVVALSGGPDSLSLAAACPRVTLLRKDNWKLASLTVNHGWRTESEIEATATSQCAKELGFTHANVLSTTPCDFSTHQGPEADAREMRWSLLAHSTLNLLKQNSQRRAIILTGHTLDDQAETVLLGLARGASARSLSAMRELNKVNPQTGLPQIRKEHHHDTKKDLEIWVGRPLINIRREITHKACKEAGLVPAFDPTNRYDGPIRTAAGEPLRRAALRDILLPQLGKALGQDPAPALARVASLAADDEAALQIWANQVLDEAWLAPQAWQLGQPLILKIPPLEHLPVAVLRRVLREAGEIAGWDNSALRRVHLDAGAELITNWHGQSGVHLPGLTLVREQGYLRFLGKIELDKLK